LPFDPVVRVKSHQELSSLVALHAELPVVGSVITVIVPVDPSHRVTPVSVSITGSAVRLLISSSSASAACVAEIQLVKKTSTISNLEKILSRINRLFIVNIGVF
jgi:hypothetical protein